MIIGDLKGSTWDVSILSPIYDNTRKSIYCMSTCSPFLNTVSWHVCHGVHEPPLAAVTVSEINRRGKGYFGSRIQFVGDHAIAFGLWQGGDMMVEGHGGGKSLIS